MKLLSTCLCLCLCFTAFTQNDARASLRDSLPRVFIDCNSFVCYENMAHFKTEVNYVNFMRDRQEASVYLLIRSIETGSGGDEFTLYFEGQDHFKGLDDTLKYVSPASESDSNVRDGILKKLKQGLLPYLLRSPLAEKISFTVEGVGDNLNPEKITDPWNNWTFRVGANGWGNGGEVYNSISFGGNLSANRVTDKNKMSFSFFGNRNIEEYDYEDLYSRTVRDNFTFYQNYVHSIGEHWAVGFSTSLFSSTYSNIRTGASIAVPAIEFNVFPYKEATKRQLSFQYRLSFRYNLYRDTTIFEKKSELLGRQSLDIGFSQKEKWGDLSIGLSGGTYLHDFSLLSFSVNPGININLFKGFKVNLYASYELQHDQITLPKGDATDVDVLLRIRELKSGYFYYASLGFSYTFGSLFSNVVNPRMDGVGGNFFFSN